MREVRVLLEAIETREARVLLEANETREAIGGN